MKQSNLHYTQLDRTHVAIIMDGSGRWATERGLPRTAGHRAGVETVRRVIEAAPDFGIGTLTLFAFSSDNWKRPRREVSALMKLIRVYLLSETATCVKNGIRISVIGRRDRLDAALVRSIEAAEAATRQGQALHLRAAIDYSSREAILSAASRCAELSEITRETFAGLIGEADHSGGSAPDVDLLIRTSGEQRLSDFLLWECAYAELHFTRRKWPDFGREDLEVAVNEFCQRDRRFGQATVERRQANSSV
ncbi:MAG: di-trans,poly-cis-decaprenylcistransferase [Acidobacteriota bacterium]